MHVTELSTSPFTGRPIIEWIDNEIELRDAAGREIGTVVEVNPDFVVTYANTGFLGLGEARVYYVPHEFIGRSDGNDWYLTVDYDQVDAVSWRVPPGASPWSDDWTQEQLAYDLHPWHGQTRVRRYEETAARAER